MDPTRGNDILASILDKGEMSRLMKDMERICADTEETAALTDKFVPQHRQTTSQRHPAAPAARSQRRHSPPPQRRASPPPRRREYSVYDARTIMVGPPEGPEVHDYHHYSHAPPYHYYHHPPPEYHAPPPPEYYDHPHHDYYAPPLPPPPPPPEYDPYFYQEPRREYTYSVREFTSRTTTSSRDRYQRPIHDARREDRRPGTLYEEVSITDITAVCSSSSTETETKATPQPRPTNFSSPLKSTSTTEDIAALVLPKAPLILPPQVAVAAPLFTEVETMDQGKVEAIATPTTATASTSEPVTETAVPATAPAPAPTPAAVVESVGPPEQKELPATLTEAVSNISGFCNLSKPCALPLSDITDMSPLKTLRTEYNAERQLGDPVRPGVEVTEIGFGDKKQPPATASAPQEGHAVEVEDTAQIVEAAAIEKARHEESKKKPSENGEKKKKKIKDKKHEEGDGGKEEKKKKKKHKEDDGDKKKKKKKSKHDTEEDGAKTSEKKKKKKKKHKDEDDKKKHKKKKHKTDGKDEEKKKKKKHTDEEEEEKKKRKKKKLEKHKKRREESLLADEASEAGSDEEIEDGPLDSDEEAAEDEDSEILSDTSGEDLPDEDSDADKEGNLKGFIGDDIEFEEDASDEGEEIHGRNEHTKFAESGPRVMGKKARKLKKLAKEQEHHDRRITDDVIMHKTEEIGASLLREQEQLHGSLAKKSHKRHIEDDDVDPKVVAKTKAGDSPSAGTKTVPLPAVPTSRTGEPLKTEDIEPILCSLAICIAGHSIAMWHDKESRVAKPTMPSTSGRGPFSDDFTKYTFAMANGKVLVDDLATASVFRFYFGPDITPIPEDTTQEDVSKLCLNGLARRIIKEMGRVGLLPVSVAKLFTSATPSDNIPTLVARPERENFTVSIYSNGALVHEMAAADMMKDALSQVFSWFKAFSVFEAITQRFVEKTYSAKLVHKKGIDYTSKCFIKSFDDIAGIVNNKFVASCDAEIHDAVATLLKAPAEAAEFLISLRQS